MMRITCPECQFSREVDETKIPAGSKLATCPKCQTKFQFRGLDEGFGFDEPQEWSDTKVEERQDAVVEAMTDPAERAATPEPTAPEAPTHDDDITELTDVVEDEFPDEPDEFENAEQPPAPEDQGPAFPPIQGPDEGESIWDRLGVMTPPTKGRETDRETDRSGRTQATDEPDGTPYIEPPFERLDKYGFFGGVYETLKRVLFAPALFFEVMPLGGGLGKPLAFGLLIGAVQLFMQSAWEIAGVTQPATGDGMAAIGGWSGLLMALIAFPLFATAAMFLASGVYHLLLMAFGSAKGGFEATFRAGAYANAPIILGIFPMPTMEIQYTWMVMATLWGMIISVIGWKHLHKSSYVRVIPAALIPLLLGAIAFYRLLQAGMTLI